MWTTAGKKPHVNLKGFPVKIKKGFSNVNI